MIFQLFEECRSTKKINLYLEYSYGSLLFSCVGSFLRENSKDTVNSDDLVFLFLNLSVLSHFLRILYHMCMYVYIKFVLVIICHNEIGPGYNLWQGCKTLSVSSWKYLSKSMASSLVKI